MLYAFTGLDGAGKAKSGSIDATSSREARSKLKAAGVFVTNVLPEKPAAKKKDIFGLFGKRVPLKEVTSFMRQMASLVKAGIPLMETLDAVQKQTASPYFKKVLNEIMDAVRQGEPLADAMAKAPAIFDPLSVAMVRAGEAGGHLPQVLGQIADYKENALRMESSVKSAMVYPVVMTVIGVGVILFLLTYVVPKITIIFEDLGQALPFSTMILITITDTLANYGIWLGAALCAILFFLNRALKTPKGKVFMDRFLFRLWIVGSVVKAAVLSRWSHTTAVLLKAGVPLLSALKLSGEVAQNSLYTRAIEDAAVLIKEGGTIADSLEKSGLFPPVALQMIAAGEKSGQTAELLTIVADDQARELENRLAVIMSLVHPVLIVVMGLIVGFIVMAILLPIFEISQLI
ncbi:MAG: type II secretion system inner membrane protein GspF [Nitrospinota bacterium]